MQRAGHIIAEMPRTRPDYVIVEFLIFEDQHMAYSGVLSKLPPLGNVPDLVVDAINFHQVTERLDVIRKGDGLKGRSHVQTNRPLSRDKYGTHILSDRATYHQHDCLGT